MNKKFRLNFFKKVSVLVLLILGISVISIKAQDKIDPYSPIDGFSWQPKNDKIIVTVALRTIPTDSTDGIPLKLFSLKGINNSQSNSLRTSQAKISDDKKSADFEIEITPNVTQGSNFRIASDWTEIEFTVGASFHPTEISPEKLYLSPRFKIIRQVQVSTITPKDPRWQAETEGVKTITKYISVPVKVSAPMKVNVELRDATGTVAQKTNYLAGSDDKDDDIELDMQPNASIRPGIKYTITVTPIGSNTNVSPGIKEWTPINFVKNYRLNNESIKNLSTLPVVEDKKVKIKVTTVLAGKSLNLVAKGIDSNKIKVTQDDNTWDFDVDLSDVQKETIPFHFEGEGGDGQIFDGKDEEYFFKINNASKIIGPLAITYDKDNNMVLKYKLNRAIPTHQLILKAEEAGITLSDLPEPKLVDKTASEYTITIRQQVPTLIAALAVALKQNGNKEIPVLFKLVENGQSSNTIAELQFSAYGVAPTDYAKKIAELDSMLKTSDKYRKMDSATAEILRVLELSTMPTEPKEKAAIDEAAKLLTTVDDKKTRSGSFWSKFGSALIQVAPKALGLAVPLLL